MKHRVFIAVNFPEEIKQKIQAEVDELAAKFKSEDIRFLKPGNWHITISFLGYQDDEAVGNAARALEEIAGGHKPFPVKLEKIIYGPPKSPRMIWLVGSEETSRQIGNLKNMLEDKLSDFGVIFKKEKRVFTTHITLARFSRPIADRPKIEKEVDWEFEAAALDLMESHLRRSGAEYSVLSSCRFSDKMAVY